MSPLSGARATIAAAIVLGWHSVEPAQAVSTAGEQVLQCDAEMAEAVVAGDLKRLEEIYADDYVYVGSDGTLVTRSQRLEGFRSGALRYLSTKHTGATVRVYGETAIVQGQTRSKVVAGERLIEGDFRYVGVWVRQGNKWRIVLTQATRITG